MSKGVCSDGPTPTASVVLLNGPAGVGKTTVGRSRAGLAANGACIHGDALAGFIVSRVEGGVESGLGYTNGATLAANFVAGYDLVVFEYVFERRAHVERFVASFHPPAALPVHLFTLWAPLATVIAREQARPDRRPLGDRVERCYRTLEAALPELGHRIDNGVASPADVARAILRLCVAEIARVDQTPAPPDRLDPLQTRPSRTKHVQNSTP